MKCKRVFCAALAAVLLFLCACQKDSAQSASELPSQSAVSENQETALADVSDSTAAGDIALPESTGGIQENGDKKTPPAATENSTKIHTQSVPTASQTPTVSEQPQTQTVSLSVTCHNAIAFGILDNPNFQGVVPESGVYFDNNALEFTAGESVLTVFKRCLKAQKIVYQVDASGYVKSIGGLAEYDCGAQSGWLYKVNGELPNVSCKYYTLKAGDRVEFAYTCTKGDV